jgi:hypothetical protein
MVIHDMIILSGHMDVGVRRFRLKFVRTSHNLDLAFSAKKSKTCPDWDQA